MKRFEQGWHRPARHKADRHGVTLTVSTWSRFSKVPDLIDVRIENRELLTMLRDVELEEEHHSQLRLF